MQKAVRPSLQNFPILLLLLLHLLLLMTLRNAALTDEALCLLATRDHRSCLGAAQLVGIFMICHACTAGIFVEVLLLMVASGKDDR